MATYYTHLLSFHPSFLPSTTHSSRTLACTHHIMHPPHPQLPEGSKRISMSSIAVEADVAEARELGFVDVIPEGEEEPNALLVQAQPPEAAQEAEEGVESPPPPRGRSRQTAAPLPALDRKRAQVKGEAHTKPSIHLRAPSPFPHPIPPTSSSALLRLGGDPAQRRSQARDGNSGVPV